MGLATVGFNVTERQCIRVYISRKGNWEELLVGLRAPTLIARVQPSLKCSNTSLFVRVSSS